MRARGIDSFWTSTHREKAQGWLNDARRALWNAEFYFDEAARELRDFERFAHCLDMAFRYLEQARWYRMTAKGAALLATRGRELCYWQGNTTGRAEQRRRVLFWIEQNPAR